jgi:hypothetical protein
LDPQIFIPKLRKGEVDLYVNLPSLLKEELLKKGISPVGDSEHLFGLLSTSS